ncbi:MAG: hypothetical protein BRD35_04350 [Bacteroidetes bacterium QH_7_62_13]|nr:MAG: hypothetical protein BRD35_04350 [Bacteroidetes bacterium QH_7_62_13]
MTGAVERLFVVPLFVHRENPSQQLIGLFRLALLIIHVTWDGQNESEHPDAQPVNELSVLFVEEKRPGIQLDEPIPTKLLAARGFIGRFQGGHIRGDR